MMAEKEKAENFVEARPRVEIPSVPSVEDVQDAIADVGKDYRSAFDRTQRAAIERTVGKDLNPNEKTMIWVAPQDADRLKELGAVSTGKVSEGDCLMTIPTKQWLKLQARPIAESLERTNSTPEAIRAGYEKRGIDPSNVKITFTKDGRVVGGVGKPTTQELYRPGGRI